MSMPAENSPVPHRTVGELLSEIDAVDAYLNALLEAYEAGREQPLTASNVHLMLKPARTRLSIAYEALNKLLGN